MKYNDIRKFATLVKNYTQADALLAVLDQGFEPSIEDAQRAGIADPRRVINRLREYGATIYLNECKNSRGQIVKRFRLA